MKSLWLLPLLSLVILTGCRSFQVTNFEVLSDKDNRVIYRIDGTEDTFFSTRPVLALICVPDSNGDLICR